MADIASLGLKVEGTRNIDQASDSLDEFTRSGQKAEQSTEGLTKGSKKAAKEVKNTGDQSEKSRASLNNLANAAKFAAGALATVGVSIGLSQSVRQIADFQAAINGLAAVSNATASEMSALENQARLLGATSMFSAQQAAEGQRFLAQAGLEVNEILSATPGILKLATAGQLDLASAADIASNVLGGMRLEVDQLNRVNDVLAATAARSNTTIQQLGQALSFAAPFAAGAGVSIEEAASAIGSMSDAGIQASRAGTGLVGVIRQLSNVTNAGEEILEKYGLSLEQVNIESRGLGPVLGTLRKANLNTADSIALFGSEAGAAAQVLVQDYKGAIEGATGEADRMASRLGQGLTPAFLSLSSAVSESVLQLGDSGLASSLESLIRSATGVLSVYNDMLPEFVEANGLTETQADNLKLMADGFETVGTVAVLAIGGKLAGSAAAAGTSMALAATQGIRLEMQLAGVLGMSRAAAGGLYGLAAAGRAASGAMAFLGGPVGVALIAAGSLYYFRDAIFDTSREASEAEKNVRALAERMGDLTEAELRHRQVSIVRQMQETAMAIADATAEVERLKRAQSDSAARSMSGIGDIGGPNGLNALTEANIKVAQLTGTQEALQESLDKNKELMDAFGKSTDDAGDSAESAAEKIKKMDDAYASLLKNLDPAQAALNDYFDTIGKIDSLDLSGREKDRLRELAFEKHWKTMAGIAADGSEDVAKAFENPWQSTADSVAHSLQDAIASGDWGDLGEGIGNALAASMSAVINKSITDTLSKDLTSNSSAISQISAAFSGPIAGAVVGGLTQLAVSELSDVFGFGDWDPTQSRQDSQGTGSVLGSIEAKSESITRAVEGSEQGIGQLIGINQGMLQTLQSLQIGISSAAGLVQRGARDVSFNAPGYQSGSEAFGGYFGSAVAGLPGMAIGEKLFDMQSDIVEFFSLGLVDLGSLLGGKSRQVDEGINIIGGTISDLIDETLVEAYATFRVKKNALRSTKTKEQAQLLGDEVSSQFELVFEGIFESILGAGDLLGVETESRLREFEVATRRISLEGLDAAEQTAELEAVFSEIFDGAAGAAVPFIDEFQRAGEGLGETLARVANQVGVTEEVVDRLGLQFQDLTGADLARASEYLARATGGLENLIGGMQKFVSNFATEARQFELAESDLVRSLKQVNLQLPETRQGFYELLQAQDASTESGADAIAQILKVQDVAHGYYQSLEDAAIGAAEKARIAAKEIGALFRQSTDNALSALQRSVNAEMQGLQDQYDMRMKANQIATDAVREGLQAISSEVQAVKSATDQLEGSYDPIQSILRSSALDSIRSALVTGDLTGVGEAAKIASAVKESSFATKEAYELEQAKTLNLLSKLEDAGDDQITTAERSLRVLNDQADTIKRGFDQEQAKLSDILDNAQDQVDALRGIDNSTMAIADAINALSNALNLERPNAIGQAYSNAGRTLDSEGEAYWNQSIKSGSATTADLEFALWAANKENRDWFEATTGGKVPGYANGGMFGGGLRVVGERGPELEFTGSSRIMSNDDLMGSLGASKDMLNEMRALHRDFMRGLDVIARNTNKSSKQLERWDLTGLPKERDLV